MAGKVYGLDLGTYEIKVFDKKRDRIWREKDAIAMKNKNHDIDGFEKKKRTGNYKTNSPTR